MPAATLVFLALAVVATFVLNATRFGRYVFAIGGNERAARLSGIPVGRMRIAVYGITGVMAAVAGIVHVGPFSFGNPNDGAGTMIGTIAGSIMLGALANILQLNNINAALQLLTTGAIIVVAAVLQAIVGRRESATR